MTDQITELEAQLKKKEELVAELTERLEQAAEQLDRIHRTGADRGVRFAGGIPAEVVEEQRALTQELQDAVTHWEESQPTEALERIENHLTEIRGLVSNLSGTGGLPTSGSQQSSEEGTGLSGYEALKASMFSADSGSEAEVAEQTTEDTADSETAEAQEELLEPELVEPPEPIDLDTSDVDALRQAVESRDSYISYLIRKLRVAESRGGMSVDWAALENTPDELQNRLQELESRLEESLRLAEVEFALERARLGREENRLEQLEVRIRRQLKKLGLSEDGEIEKGNAQGKSDGDDEAAEGEDDSGGNRWLRMLGR